ncbi:MAG: ice-binding family protein, partial [Lacunisphaera sp.]|nr:ice-binding family protein [Lacunisphaera sp.]
MKTLMLLPVVALGAILCLPVSGTSQVLLTASDFTLLAGTAVSVGGPGPNSILNGHVHGAAGTSGFPPATVAGNVLSGAAATVIAAPNGITVQALADLNTARNALAAMVSPPANNMTGQDLGTLAAPLAPGVYAFNTSALQNGALVLDAQGQNGVAWVFQFGTFY